MDKEQEKAAKARESALQNAVGQIERQFGAGSIMKMGDDAFAVSVKAISTGALSLDLALGVGGLARGRIVEIFGPESSGKTTLIYHVLAEAQKQGGICAFIDAEHAMDPLYAKKIGVDVDELLVSQPDYGEQALEIADMLIRSGAVDVVAIDSVAALTPKTELEGQMGDQTVGLQARMMSQAMRKLAGNLNRANTLCVFTNQIREKVGVMFGSPETQPGGRALKFYSSQRLDIRRIETLKEGTDAVGNRVRVKVVKNKVAAPFRQAEFDIEYGVGISSEGCILDLGLEHNLVQKSGSFFSYGEERIGQGRNNAKAYLRDHPEIAKEIEAKIYEAVGIAQGATVAEMPAPAEGRGRGAGGAGRLTIADEELRRAFDLAGRALSVRDRSIAELRTYLEGKRVEPDLIERGGGRARAHARARRRPLRGALHRGPPLADGVGARPDRAGPPPPRHPAGADRSRRSRGAAARTSSRPPAACSPSGFGAARGRSRAQPRLAAPRPPRLRRGARVRRRPGARPRGLSLRRPRRELPSETAGRPAPCET